MILNKDIYSENNNNTYQDLEHVLNYKFRDKNLLLTALTHPSSKTIDFGDYERLEFLGDAILNYIVSNNIYHNFPFENEGKLSKRRANIVDSKTLSEVGVRLNLIKYTKINPCIEKENKKVRFGRRC